MDDQVFTRRGRQLRTGGISTGSICPHFALPRALPGPPALRVDQAEERALICVAVADVEGRANILLQQLDNTDHCGVGRFFLLSVSPFSIYCFFLIVSKLCVCGRGDRGAGGSLYRGRYLPRLPGGRPGH
jgi:hypothetical protein